MCRKCIKLEFDDKLEHKFGNSFQICEGDFNKLLLFLKKEFIYMNSWLVIKKLIIKKLFTK